MEDEGGHPPADCDLGSEEEEEEELESPPR